MIFTGARHPCLAHPVTKRRNKVAWVQETSYSYSIITTMSLISLRELLAQLIVASHIANRAPYFLSRQQEISRI